MKGVTCEGCYAFLGAGLMIIIDYKHSESGFTFDFEAKAGGGVGSSTTVTVTDPSISGVNLITLMAPGEEMHTSLGFGLSMYFKFGGLTATLSGSGSATGSASYSNTQKAYMSTGIEYVGSTDVYSFPSVENAIASLPTYSERSFVANSFSVNLVLTAIQDFRISFAAGLIDFNFSVTVFAHIAGSKSSTSNAEVSIIPVSNPGAADSQRSRNILQTESLPPLSPVTFIPGDVVPIRFTYSGFNPLESTVLFYAIQKHGTEHPIMTKNFTTSPTGSGYFDANWTVPWDYSLAGEGRKNTRIIMSASNKMFDLYKSPSFGTTVFTDDDGIFSSPSASEVVPSDKPYILRWNAALLFHFQPTIWGSQLGSEVSTPNVTFVLFAKKMSSNGTVIISESQYRNLTVGAVPNTGECSVIFPSSLSAIGDRFYIVVESVLKDNVSGWSKSYFTLDSGYLASNSIGGSMASSTRKLKTVRVDRTMSLETKRRISSANSCDSQTAVTVGLSVEVKSGNVHVYGLGDLELTSQYQSFPLLSPKTTCLESIGSQSSGNPTFSPTLNPTSRSPTLSSSLNPTSCSPTLSSSLNPTSSSPTLSSSLNPTSCSPTLSSSLNPTSSSPTLSSSLNPTSRSPTLSSSLNPTSCSPTLSSSLNPTDRKSTRLNSSHLRASRMPSSA